MKDRSSARRLGGHGACFLRPALVPLVPLVLSLLIGAIVAGADDARVNALGEFGRGLGLSFQLQDDVLGTLKRRCLLA